MQVLEPHVCYPIFWSDYEKYFQEKFLNETMSKLENSLIAHVWNKLSSGVTLTQSSNVPYIKLAEKYCPRVLEASVTF